MGAFKRHRTTPIEAIYVQRSLFRNEEVVLKMTVDRRRSVRVDVLRPLLHEGLASLDNGRELKSFRPDSGRLSIQRSPLMGQPSPESRVRLVSVNYGLSLQPGRITAGRPTWDLKLTARRDEVPDRTWTLDRQTLTPLRITVRGGESGELTALQALSFRVLEGRVPDLKLEPGGRIQPVRLWGPEPWTGAARQRARLGFDPAMPPRLPYGFTVLARELGGAEAKPFFALRVSDGIQTATLYQWSSRVHGEANPVGQDPLYLDQRGVRFAVFGDLPPELARTLLGSLLLPSAQPNTRP
ncbi:MAG: hypothetical protein MH204_07295 [Fimbriimonadaceae bacterium]|nr:hypothetical protein [Fimbriimonadaceae bacterium]